MKTWKKALIFVLCLLPVGLIGGWFTVEMLCGSMDPSMLETGIQQAGSPEALKALTLLSTMIYVVLSGFFGYILAVKIGLMRPFRLEITILIRVLSISVVAAAIFSLDAWTFANWIPAVKESYTTAGSFDAVTWIASILYGGVIEEVLIRLFLMSLAALIGWKLFFRKEEQPPVTVLVCANIAAALVFAASHLPATSLTLGLTPLIVLRCFLLNGAAGLLFGRFYRKYGIQYAMLAHMLFHIVSRTIWLIAL